MADDRDSYSSHQDQLSASAPTLQRLNLLQNAYEEAFAGHIVLRQVGFILFDQISAEELADIFVRYPVVVKSVLACVNVATRAIARDLDITINTYAPSINPMKAASIAGYIKPMLPKELAIPSLIELDRFFWTDKEMRALKGNWEKKVEDALNTHASVVFKKRMFICGDEQFEIDAAHPSCGEPIELAVDVKRIESPRDIHKRSDEIVNKATRFKTTYPNGQFVAFVYYPFPSQHNNLQSRLQDENVDAVFFASETESSIEHGAKLLAGKYGLLREEAGEDECDK